MSLLNSLVEDLQLGVLLLQRKFGHERLRERLHGAIESLWLHERTARSLQKLKHTCALGE